MALTPIGKRTLAGFRAKYGDKEGEKRFNEAMKNGTIDRGKMENLLVADDKATKNDIADEGTPAELAAVQRAVDQHNIAGLDDVTSRTPPQPNPTRPTTRRAPSGLAGIRRQPAPSGNARSARGSYQKRPG